MSARITDQEKRCKYVVASDYSTGSTELFSQTEELVCFALVATAPTIQQRRVSGISYFLSPEYFVWVPGDLSSPTTDNQRSSATARQLFEANGSRIHIFVRRTPYDDWFDIGKGMRSGIRGSGPSVNEIQLREIHVQLAVKLPESLWLLFGGHPGWSLVIGSEEVEVSTPDSVLEAIRAAWDQPTIDLRISRYAGDSLFAIADESGLATVNYRCESGEYVSGVIGSQFENHSTYFFRKSDGWDYEVPVEEVIPRIEALSIIQSYVLTGAPTGLSRLV